MKNLLKAGALLALFSSNIACTTEDEIAFTQYKNQVMYYDNAIGNAPRYNGDTTKALNAYGNPPKPAPNPTFDARILKEKAEKEHAKVQSEKTDKAINKRNNGFNL